MSGVFGVGIGGLILLGTPLFVALFLLVLVLYPTADPPLDIANYFTSMTPLMGQPYLLPIALFTLAGFILARGGAPRRLLAVADAVFGRVPGGLAIVTVCMLAFFTAFTGASGVTIIALGGMLYPLMKERGYPDGFNLGLITGAGSIGLLFFPSLPVFLYVTVANLSGTPINADDLFLAGLLPGLLMVLVFSGYSIHQGVKLEIPRVHKGWRDVAKAAREAIWELLLPVLIVGLLVSGTIGLGDVPVVTVVYIFVSEVVIHRDLSLRGDMPRVIADAMAMVGAIVVILAVIIGLNNFLKDQEVPQALLSFLQEHIDPDDKLLFLIGLNLFLLIVGCLMDIFSALVAVLPLVLPLADSYGIDPLHLGVIFLANLEVGYLTPPVGMNLFISGLTFKKPILVVTRAILPFLLLLILTLGVITYWPALSTALPEAFDDAPVPTLPMPGDTTPIGAPAADPIDLLEEDEDDLDKYLEDDE